MKKTRYLRSLLIFITFLVGCTPSVSSSDSVPFIRPSSSSETYEGDSLIDSSDILASSNDDTESSITSSIGQASILSIEISDNYSYYTVGETFGHIANLTVIFNLSNNTTLDVSNRLNYYDLRITNNQYKTVDINKPFTVVGTYYVEALYKRDHRISSNKLTIDVRPSFTKVNNIKVDATESFTYSDLENSLGFNISYPSTGDVNVLVLPIELSDFPFNQSLFGDNYMHTLETAFNGNGAVDTGYWESITSYYTKSSQGNLNFNFEIAPVYQSSYRGVEVLEKYGFWGVEVLAQNALDYYVSENGTTATKKYDNDNDGYIDGLWLVYSSPDYGNEWYDDHPAADMYWAFRTYSTQNAPNINSPTLHSYAWASISFLERMQEPTMIDTHVFIHETGHLLGLPDYYSYDQSISSQGGLAMMDLNIGDHDSFSKMALGWSNPYVVTENSIIKINPNVLSGDVILLSDNWNGTAFDEYILLDFVSPVGLNELDALNRYGGFPLYFTEKGIRMYHVDARLGEYKYLKAGEHGMQSSGIYAFKEHDDPLYYVSTEKVKTLNKVGHLPRISFDESLSYRDRDSGFIIINSNSPSRTAISEQPYMQNRLLTIVSADGMNTETFGTYATNNSLFQVGDSWTLCGRGLTISSSEAGTLNNGETLRWIITVLAIDDNEATLQFRKF